ncbi:hypothetical protein Nepgr_002184 [Nepenthes gracilis]|uniref:Pentatricopeptide repeat-containing protein n=1 Tax=Nepenthes gracilis TaxID=150966 RepID=A0AAD3P3H9_NEPGR|nr:hypothetical protein Nepgr_002184 [Nepenthes gracilis]
MLPEDKTTKLQFLKTGVSRLSQLLVSKSHKLLNNTCTTPISSLVQPLRCLTSLSLDNVDYTKIIQLCTRTGSVNHGKLAHAHMIKSAFRPCLFLQNNLLNMYCKFDEVDVAHRLFDKMPKRDVISWNLLISGYSQMVGWLMSSSVLDNVSWNSLIAGYIRAGFNEEVLKQFVKMHQCGFTLSSYVLGSVLQACSNFDNCVEYGKMIHGCVVKLGLDLDVVVGTALLDMYAKNADLDDAIHLFKFTPNRNVVMYNALIAGYVHNESICAEFGNETFVLFSEMQRQGIAPSIFTFSSMLRACNAIEAFDYGKQIHALICKKNIQSDEFIGSGLVEVYSLSGSVYDALKCFDSTPKLDIVSWTSMISCYVRNGQYEDAYALFHKVLAYGRKPDEFMISSMLSACVNMSTVRSGEQVQGYALKTGIGSFTIVKNAQMCFYADSGDIDSANLTFKEIENPGVVSWSVMIHSNAQHGCAREALHLFDLMKRCQIPPNQITFLGVLTACSHTGLVDEGLRYFDSMTEDHGVTPNVKHYACIVDLLGRAGRLADAEKFIMSSGFEDNPVIWRALLSACRLHKDSAMGKRVAEKVILLEPHAAASYVLLYNIYADAGIEVPAIKIRELMKDQEWETVELCQIFRVSVCFDARLKQHFSELLCIKTKVLLAIMRR